MSTDEITKARMRKALQEQRERYDAHYQVAEARFLETWIKGVKLVGEAYFEHKAPVYGPDIPPAASLDEVSNKWQVKPNYDLINKSIGVLSGGEAALLAVMCSFYNAEWGGKLMQDLGLRGMADVASKLDLDGREIVGVLLMYYGGW